MDMLKCDIEEDFSLPKAPEGMVKVKHCRMKYIRKQAVITSLYHKQSRVSTDRLSRFTAEKRKKVLKKNDYVFSGNFIKILVDGSEEFVFVLGFRVLTEKKENLIDTFYPLRNKKGVKNSNVGILFDLHKVDEITNKLVYVKSVVDPISISNFVRHVESDELYNLLS